MVKMNYWIHLVLTVVLVMCHGSCASFSPADKYFIACGSSQNITFQGQTFVPDSVQSSLLLKSQANYAVATSNSNAPSPIYQSARIFSGIASFKFKIHKAGRHWVRLYFYPFPELGQNMTSASITVVTENFVLLDNFTFKNYGGSYLFKEYAINVTSDTLVITFIPSKNSVAFVNAMEVVSIPDEVLPDQALALNPSTPFSGLSDLALETVYRLNMGGPLLTDQVDSLGRTWVNDVLYLHVNSSAVNISVNDQAIKYPVSVTPETAPNWVYATAETMGDANPAYSNMTWVFSVNPIYMYFVRVHFCDILSKSLNTLVFNVFLNTDIALGSLDLSSLTGDLRVPYYRDFVVNSSANSDTLTVSVGPDSMAYYPNAIINGLEIMKISNEARSLDGVSSIQILLPKLSSKKNNLQVIIGSAVGAAVTVVFLIGLCYFCSVACRSKTIQKGGTASCISRTSSNLGRFFTFQEILDATNKFDESLLLGVGGFGRVYKGTLEDGTTKVAVKRGKPGSLQGLAEFQAEIAIVLKLRHRHLVSLIGYCDECSEMILIYEYMANGTLRSHLYGTDLRPLSWKQRLKICIGAARGLHYLHTGAPQSIIHRDVKTTNILLDDNFAAKVADFGISKIIPALDQTHVSTAVKGTFGYFDPEYFRRLQLTVKSDVYSFGVVLMEVLCNRPALNHGLPTEQINIAEWAMSWQEKGMLDQIMDPNLVGKVNPASLKKFRETALKCLAKLGVNRPSMEYVLWNLERALQLEEIESTVIEPEDNSTNHILSIQLTPLEPFDSSVSMNDWVNSGTDDDAEDVV